MGATNSQTEPEMSCLHAQAVKAGRKFDLSVALFAPGWTNETANSWDQFIDNECRYAVEFFNNNNKHICIAP